SSSYTAPPLPAQLHRHRHRSAGVGTAPPASAPLRRRRHGSAGPGSPPPAAARTRRCARDEAAVETWYTCARARSAIRAFFIRKGVEARDARALEEDL